METSPTFTLQKLWFYVHPTIRTLSLIHALTGYIASITHADILEDDDDDSSDEDDDNEDDNDDDDDLEDDDDSDEGSMSEGDLSESEAERRKRRRRRKRRKQREREELANDQSLERERRALLGLDDDEDGAGGGKASTGLGDGREARLKGGIVRGGEVLSLLWDRMQKMSGDPTAHALYASLFLFASQPYVRTLLLWITTGHLSDTYSEFMVMEDARVTRASLESDPTDEYWERRYILRDETVLANLERHKAYAAIEAQAQAAGEEEIEAAAAVEGGWDEDLGLGLLAAQQLLQQEQGGGGAV
ncbi:hypothetical protein A4X13_0g7459 [Tilletia indica]|uniref:Spindle pole body component n=1 Tax=Tilletia indica TaxID=43049 RepID=A0A8T8SK48_9BASI|nr:hypothetical protein A4X13_0g7459 [Tilletia indica]